MNVTMNNMNSNHGEDDGEDGFPADFEDFDWEDNVQKDVDNETDNDEEGDILDYKLMCTVINSPGGRPKFWIPIVGTHVEIDKERIFDTLQEGLNAYYIYAKHAGFDTRLGSEKTKNDILQYKYVFCNRAGEAKKYNVDTSNGEKGKQKRKKASHMSKCPSRICFKVLEDGSFRYGVNKLEEMHNHELYTNTTVHMAKHKRKLDFFDMTLINQLSQKNIGASKAHHMIGGIKGDNQGPKCSDYKNFSRDLNRYIEDTDANILVELMNLRKENVRDFSFVHLLEDSELRAVFWADNVAKRNYKEFSDIVSFDATYHTNKYNLVFVPFTGVDNHKKSVTLGGALLARETAEYYTWLLKSWLDAFGKQPVIVVTDQEAAVAVAVEKVDERVIYGTDFKLRLQRLIWNNCHDPVVFEFKWNALMEEFDLTSNKWLKDMYILRHKWIPAFFKDNPLSGLMRSTSRSEIENSFFKNYFSKHSTLTIFMFKFDAAMDKQRRIQSENDFNSIAKKLSLESKLAFEVQASYFYTHAVMRIFQKEIHDCVYACSPGPIVSYGDYDSHLVVEQISGVPGENQSTFLNKFTKKTVFKYEVKVYEREGTITCSCMVFEHQGMLCRHILCIMKTRFMKAIPENT
ncbi:hypothetical protein LXL04_028306 [Taraxacum kok-saghyz]